MPFSRLFPALVARLTLGDMAALPTDHSASMLVVDRSRGGVPANRPLGVLVLVLALIAAVVTPQILATGLAGAASTVPLPLPPAVGSCLELGGDMAVVPCSEPHDAEVFRSWPAAAGPARQTEQHGVPLDDPTRAAIEYAECWPALGGYLGVGAADSSAGRWQPLPPQAIAHFVLGPTTPTSAGLRWSACVLTTPTGRAFTGSVAHTAGSRTPDRPSDFGTCIIVSYYFPHVSSCDHPHRIELLGYFVPTQAMLDAGSVLVGYSTEEAQAECVTLARWLTGAADPTYGGRLRIVAESVFGLTDFSQDEDTAGLVGGLLHATHCLADLTGRGTLQASIVGLGSGELVVS